MQPTNGSYRRASPSTVTGSATSGRRRGKALGLVLLAMALLMGGGIAILQTVRTGRAAVAEDERLTSMFARMMEDIRKSHKTQLEQQGKTLLQGVLHELGDYRPSCSSRWYDALPGGEGKHARGRHHCHSCRLPPLPCPRSALRPHIVRGRATAFSDRSIFQDVTLDCRVLNEEGNFSMAIPRDECGAVLSCAPSGRRGW